jgi:hypothetical protein
MSFLLCCFLGNKDKTTICDIEKNIKHLDKIETKVINDKDNRNDINYSKEYDFINKRKNSKNRETLIIIDEFEKCKYWFFEIVKYSVYKYDDYGKNKKELCEHIFKCINIDIIFKYYKKYNTIYNNFNSENIIKFINNNKNSEFIQDIKISENIYRFH